MAGQVIRTTGPMGHGYASWLASECLFPVVPKDVDQSVILGPGSTYTVQNQSGWDLTIENDTDQTLNFGIVWPVRSSQHPQVWIVTPAVPVPEFTDVTDADAWLEANA